MYSELKCKSNFSFLVGASHPEELVEKSVALGLKALAINDSHGVYGAPKAYWAHLGLKKKLPGLDFRFLASAEVFIKEHQPLVLIPKSRLAYGLMCRLLTESHRGKEKGQSHLTLEQLQEFSREPGFRDLFAFINQPQGVLFFKEIFSESLFYFVSRFLDGRDQKRIDQALEIEKKFKVSSVATNDVLYHDLERRPLQDCLTCIKEKTDLTRAGFLLNPNSERRLKAPLEMKTLFKDFPQWIERTVEISDQCTFDLSELKYRYPSEWIPEQHTAQSYLHDLVWQGAEDRYKKKIPDEVRRQIQYELTLIEQLNYADYFLTIFDIVDFARKKEILCQGRGSAANSVVCYCLGITAVDPVRMNLLFERFISVERNEPPDIDVDFENERREEVIQYIYEKYGRHRAGMVSAVVTYQSRSALREIAKAFAIPVGAGSSKWVKRNFSDLAQACPIPDSESQIQKLALELKGFPRHLSIHSGGFTLSADPITEIVPIEPARMDGRTIIQWDKYDLDYLGLLKVDILALGMLTALKKTLKSLGMSLADIPSEDLETYKLIQRADTVGTFQVESRAQMNMSGRLRPECFYDLVVQVAIVRPGPIVGKMVHPYLKRRHGLEPITYPHPKLEDILGKTLGVPIFQEQVMKIAIELAGYTPGEADELRRAIGAWRSSGCITKVAEKLVRELQAQGIPKDYVNLILEQLKGFAHYGFPESHAASFALLSYASCYLKRHFPAEFALGLVNSQPMGFYAVHTILDDAKKHGVRILDIDPNLSVYDCTLENGAIRLGLRLIRGLSKIESERILSNRPYGSFSDFLKKTSVRSKILETMAMANFFASLESDFSKNPRKVLWRVLSAHVANQKSQLDFLSGFEDGDSSVEFAPLNEFAQVRADYESYGFSNRDHPMAALRRQMKLPKQKIRDVKVSAHGSRVQTSGLLMVRQKPPTANGVCFAAIEDETGYLDLVFFKKEYQKFKEVLSHHSFFKVFGVYTNRNSEAGHGSVTVKKLQSLFEQDQESVDDLNESIFLGRGSYF